jgi:DNA polymerase III subunit chi
VIVDFYHLTATPLERVLPSIAEKVLAGGGRLLVVAAADQLARLDEQMWSYSRDSFLPHGRERAESQPVLLSEDPVPANGAGNIALADGRWRDEALAFARTFYFFDDVSRESAREAWRALKAKPEVEARYWKQDERGKWVQGP